MRYESLSTLCDITIGRTPPRKEATYWGKGNKWVSISDMKTKIITSTKEEITEKAVKSIRCRKIPKGTLLYSFKLSIGKKAFAGDDVYTNEAIAALIIKNKSILDNNYLFYALDEIKLIGGNNAAMGTTLNSKSLAALKIPRPPLEDQKRIASLLSRVEALIAKRKESIDLLDELLKSTFLEKFGDPVKNRKGWELLPFSLIGDFSSGGTPKKDEKRFWSGNFPWVSPKDMKTNRISDSQDHISQDVFIETSLKKISPIQVLIVVRGMILAHSFPVAINLVDIAINQDMKAIKPKSNIDAIFLQYCLIALKRQILKLISTAGHGTKRFDKEAIQKLMIIVPPLSLQKQFSCIVDKVESIKSRYQKSLSELENLYGSLSQKAFKGELDLEKIFQDNEPEQPIPKTVSIQAFQPKAEENEIAHATKSKEWLTLGNLALVSVGFFFVKKLVDVLSNKKIEKDEIKITESFLEENIDKNTVFEMLSKSDGALSFIEIWGDIDEALFSGQLNEYSLEPGWEPVLYSHIKNRIFQLLDENRIIQNFDEGRKEMLLRVNR